MSRARDLRDELLLRIHLPGERFRYLPSAEEPRYTGKRKPKLIALALGSFRTRRDLRDPPRFCATLRENVVESWDEDSRAGRSSLMLRTRWSRVRKSGSGEATKPGNIVAPN